MFRIRPAFVSDMPAMRLLFRETVLSVNRRDYTAEEVADWASCGEGETHWRELFARQRCFVAEDARGKMTGFASADGEGYMHMLFVHKDFQRCGVATALYAAVERFAREAGAVRIASEVSETARGFFERQGFRVDAKQRRRAGRLELTNYRMSKALEPFCGSGETDELHIL